jgi:hypothetical protein
MNEWISEIYIVFCSEIYAGLYMDGYIELCVETLYDEARAE